MPQSSCDPRPPAAAAAANTALGAAADLEVTDRRPSIPPPAARPTRLSDQWSHVDKQRSNSAQPAQLRLGRADEDIGPLSASARLAEWRADGWASEGGGSVTLGGAPITRDQSTRSTICSCDRICPHSPAGHATSPSQRRAVCWLQMPPPSAPLPLIAATSSSAVSLSHAPLTSLSQSQRRCPVHRSCEHGQRIDPATLVDRRQRADDGSLSDPLALPFMAPLARADQ